MGILDVVHVNITIIDGTVITVIPETIEEDCSKDSGNFTPVFINGIEIVQGGGAAVGSVLSELAVLKVIEVKDAHSYTEPLPVQAEQQIVLAEMDVPALSAGVANADAIFDKDRNTSCVLAAAAQSIIWPLTHPILVNRFLLTGALNVISMTAVTPDGTIKNIFFPGTTEISRDTLNIEPFYLSSLTITQGAGSPGSLISELIIQKVIEVKSFSQVQLAQLTEFYGQKVYFDPFMNREMAQTTTVNYLLLRRALEVDADNDPAINNDSTVVSMTSDIVDLERINVKFYVPTDDIRAVKKHCTALASVEVGANARCTAIKYRIYKNAIATGTLTALTAQKTITFAALSFDGAASRVVAAILQDLVYAVIEEHSDLVLEISVWGRQVASVAVPAPITLWHRRGLGDCKLIVESVTQTPQVI
jgi:hypothetical protein